MTPACATHRPCSTRLYSCGAVVFTLKPMGAGAGFFREIVADECCPRCSVNTSLLGLICKASAIVTGLEAAQRAEKDCPFKTTPLLGVLCWFVEERQSVF